MKRFRPLLLPAAAILLAALLNTFLLMNLHVPSGSMEPTIPAGAMVLANRITYRFREPMAGDVIVFRHEAAEGHFLIKRIIAVPGQTFAISEGRVYLDGQLLPEEYVTDFSADDYPKIQIPEGCYLVLGDNRPVSMDSRFWDDPFIRREDILAQALFVYYPRFHRL